MDLSLVVQTGLLYGLFLSVVMAVTLLGSLRLNPEILIDDYPPDIRAKWGPISPQARRLKLWVGLPAMALVLGLLAAQAAQVVQRSGGFHFLEVTLSLWLSMMLFNLVDLLVLDWLVLLTFRPRLAILPGTEGLAGYSDYQFHFIGFLKGTVGITLASPILAAIAYGIYALVA